MLQQFSWGHFLIAMVVLNLVWYVLVLAFFYSNEVSALLGGGADGTTVGGKAPVAKAKGKDMAAGTADGDIEREVDAALMGSSRLPDGVQVKTSAEVSFSGGDVDGRYDQVGLIADVVQELKSLFSELEKGAGDKRDFFRLLGKLKEEYGPIGGHPSVGALTGFIVERLLFT